MPVWLAHMGEFSGARRRGADAGFRLRGISRFHGGPRAQFHAHVAMGARAVDAVRTTKHSDSVQTVLVKGE